MSVLKIRRSTGPLRGTCRVPGDKSISHRAVMLAGLADGESRVRGFLDGGDCRATIGAMRTLGVEVEQSGKEEFKIRGRGLHGLVAPAGDVDCDNSGTTMRLLAGILAGQRFGSRLTGTPQLSGRPMGRIIEPLRQMGAVIEGRDGCAPLDIEGRGETTLRGIEYEMPVASAQLKSCLLLAGLYAEAPTAVLQPGPARDHTERMLTAMGAPVRRVGDRISIDPSGVSLAPLDVAVPGDISSAAFPLVAACLVPGSELRIAGVGINPTRTGIVDALWRMGAAIDVEERREVSGEPVADLVVRHAELRGTSFDGDEIVTMIDELPMLALAAAVAEGETAIRGAAELRVKETDRIATTAQELNRLGAGIETLDDGMIIPGAAKLHGATVSSHGDHRLALMLSVAGLVAAGETEVGEAQVTDDSFPGFVQLLTDLGAQIRP